MSPVMATTSTQPVMVVCSRESPITTTVLIAPSSVGLVALGKHDVVCHTTADPKGYNKEFCCPHHCSTAETTSVPDAFLGICQLCQGSSSGKFSLSELSLPPIPDVLCWCLCGVCHGHQWGLNCRGLQCLNPMEYNFTRHICLLVMVCGPCHKCTEWFFFPLLWIVRSFMLVIQLSPSHPYIWWGILLWGLAESHPIPLPSLCGREGVFLSRLCSTWWHSQLWICGGC